MAAAVLGVLLVTACAEPVDPPFPGSARSLRELGTAALHGLSTGDRALLERYRLAAREHNEVVWPQLPASNPRAAYPVDLAWENIQLRNERALNRLSGMFEGRELDLRGARCRGDTRTFRTFEVHTDCWVTLEVGGLGLIEAQLFKDVLERNGGLKIFRYYEEPIRRRRADD